MEVTEYDEYIPEKELNMNFRIPRKRTAEESFGADANYGYPVGPSNYANAEKLSAYDHLSNAASRASNHSNYRRAVPYSSLEKSEFNLDTSKRPPMISGNQNTSIGISSFPRRSSVMEEKYPERSTEAAGSRFGPSWPRIARDNSHFDENRSWAPNSNRGAENRSLLLSSYTNRSLCLLSDKGEVLGERRGILEKPFGWNAGSFNEGYNGGKTSNEGYNVGNSFNESFNVGKSFNEGYRGGNSFDKGYNGGKSFNGGFRGGKSFNGGFRGGNSFDKGYNGGKSFNEGFRGGKSFNDRNNLGSNNNGGNGFSGGFNKRGFRNENNTTQGKFGGGQDVNQGKFNSGRYWKEKPKLPKPNIPPLVIPDKKDETLPMDLRQMFQPLFCKLCGLQMTSNVMAKMHYVSKNHEKKIRKYLVEHSEKTGEPLHPRASVDATKEKKVKEEDKDPRNFHCEICDLQLTGKQHADSHYMGKSHNAVRMGKKKPAGKGYFDPNGKWIRKSKETMPGLAEGDDGFGADFRKGSEDNNALGTEESNPKPSGKSLEPFTCSLCSVSCVSQDQLNIHLGGSKHKKKLKMKGLSPDNFTLPKDSEQQDGTNVTEDAASSVDADETLKNKYITPNGYFYCEKCNLTVNSEIQFKQHLASKKHANKANAKKEQQGGEA